MAEYEFEEVEGAQFRLLWEMLAIALILPLSRFPPFDIYSSCPSCLRSIVWVSICLAFHHFIGGFLIRMLLACLPYFILSFSVTAWLAAEAGSA